MLMPTTSFHAHSHYRLIIFDHDGTIVDTVKDIGTAANFALKNFGFHELALEKFVHFIGWGMRETVRKAMPVNLQNEHHKDLIDQLYKQMHDYYNLHPYHHSLAYEKIPELLKTLQDKNLALAIYSNKDEVILKTLAAHFFPSIYFAEVIGIKCTTSPKKPDPAPILTLANSLGISDPQEILLVGDSNVDLETASNSGCDLAYVTWGYGKLSDEQLDNASIRCFKITNVPELELLLQ
ncbi:MAG: HAD family hydrolase [Oligoflexia bacterium]|nr:HAD family hydrolase [Oligoflexia bacterium]MBF0366518.1 HAD family hydrolase [Oligoflexia bacterium]